MAYTHNQPEFVAIVDNQRVASDMVEKC
jgi:hypothetical protein